MYNIFVNFGSMYTARPRNSKIHLRVLADESYSKVTTTSGNNDNKANKSDVWSRRREKVERTHKTGTAIARDVQ